jgi:hypothetical protein
MSRVVYRPIDIALRLTRAEAMALRDMLEYDGFPAARNLRAALDEAVVQTSGSASPPPFRALVVGLDADRRLVENPEAEV